MSALTKEDLDRVMRKYPGLVEELEYNTPEDVADAYGLSYFYMTKIRRVALDHDVISPYDTGERPDPWALAEQE